MAAVETGQPRSHGKGGKKKKKRVGVRIDMTPMVDVAMLLLTFFMLTTVFNMPQTMELNLPPDDNAKVEVGESSLITIRVAHDFTIYWNQGSDPKLQRVEFKELRKFLKERLQMNPKLITLVKVDREATYNNMVNIMDELNLANITRFSLAPMKDDDKKLMAKAG
jgi:biopolymer transport protein ExbD